MEGWAGSSVGRRRELITAAKAWQMNDAEDRYLEWQWKSGPDRRTGFSWFPWRHGEALEY